MDWGFVWIMFVLKIPLVMLLYIVWYAIKAVPEPAADEGDGGTRKPRHPHRDPPSRNPRGRGPHGDPSVTPPARVRAPLSVRAREHDGQT